MIIQAVFWAMQQSTDGPTAKLLLIMLCNYADQNGRTYVGQKRLAGDCDVSERTVRDWLDKFEKANLITRAPRHAKGLRTSDLITISLPADSAARSPADNSKNHRQILPGNLLDEPREEGAIASDPTGKVWVVMGSPEWQAVKALRGRQPPTMQHGNEFGWYIAQDEIAAAKGSKP